MEERAGGHDGCKRERRNRGAFFYADDGMVPSTDPDWLQGAFEILTGMFNIVRLWTKTVNMVGMFYCP